MTENQTNQSNTLYSRSLALLHEALYPNILYIPVGVAAVIFNLAVIVTIGATKSLHTKCFVLLIANACSDLLLGSGYAAVGIVRISRYYFELGEVMTSWRCCFEVCDIAFGQLITLGLAAVLVVDRLASVFFSQQYRLWSKRKWTTTLISLAFFFAAAQLSVHFRDSWQNRDRIVLTCGIEDTATDDDLYILLLVQMTTSLIVVGANILLYLAIKKRQRKIHSAVDQRQVNQNEIARLQRDLKTFKTITIIVVLHILTHLGSRLVIFVVSRVADDRAKTMSNRYGRAIVELNAALHFFVLYGTSSQFNKAVRNLVGKVIKNSHAVNANSAPTANAS